MSVVYKFVSSPVIKSAGEEILKQFIGLEVPINELPRIGRLGAERSALGKYPDYLFHDRYVVMTTEALVMAAFTQKRYKLAEFLNSSDIVAEVFTVERALVTEV